MDLNETIRQLRSERARLDAVIAQLESLAADGNPPASHSHRGRKFMGRLMNRPTWEFQWPSLPAPAKQNFGLKAPYNRPRLKITEIRTGDCEFRILCGGSRSRSFALTGDYLAEDP